CSTPLSLSSRRRHTRFSRDWSSDVCSSDLTVDPAARTLRQQAMRMLWDILHERPVVIWRGAREYLRGGPRVFAKIRVMLDHRPEIGRASRRATAPMKHVARTAHTTITSVVQ